MRRLNMRIVVLASILILLAVVAAQDEPYKLGKDPQRQDGVPQGQVTKHSWTSKVFDGTTRDYYVYVPKQYE